MYLMTNNRERTMTRKEWLDEGREWLDRALKGRNETGVWWRRHDEYNKG